MEDQKQRVYDALKKMGIKYEVVEHEPVHTMEDMDRLGLPEKGTLCKNLFLRDSKGKRHFLITADEKTKVDLKTLGRQLGAGNLSFASEERLEKYLGVKQGSVTPFALMNDTDHAVEFFIDKNLSRCKSMGIHPLENTATVFLSFKDLDKFLWNHVYKDAYIKVTNESEDNYGRMAEQAESAGFQTEADAGDTGKTFLETVGTDPDKMGDWNWSRNDSHGRFDDGIYGITLSDTGSIGSTDVRSE